MKFDKIPPEKVDELLKLVSAKTGTSKEALVSYIQSGKLEKLLGNLKPDQVSKVESALSDKKAAEELLSSPQAKQLLNKLLNSK